MKEIKSNPSKIMTTYLVPAKEDITVVTIAGSKVVKLTEIAIMDRQSNGSFIAKDRLLTTYRNIKLLGKDELSKEVTTANEQVINEVSTRISREYKSLKTIDEKMNQIEMQLDDIEN